MSKAVFVISWVGPVHCSARIKCTTESVQRSRVDIQCVGRGCVVRGVPPRIVDAFFAETVVIDCGPKEFILGPMSCVSLLRLWRCGIVRSTPCVPVSLRSHHFGTCGRVRAVREEGGCRRLWCIKVDPLCVMGLITVSVANLPWSGWFSLGDRRSRNSDDRVALCVVVVWVSSRCVAGPSDLGWGSGGGRALGRVYVAVLPCILT